MDYGRISQEAVRRGRLPFSPLNYTPQQTKSSPKKIIGHIGQTRLWPIGIAVRINANKISADGCAKYGAIAEVPSL